MSCQVKKHTNSLSDDKGRFIMQHLKQEEELSMIVEYASLKDMPLEERRKQAQKPLYLTRYE